MSYRFCKHFYKKKFRGSAALFLTVATAAMVSAIALSLVKINAAASSKLLLTKRQLQAQQYALTEAELVKALPYRNISSDTYNLNTYGTVPISGSDYYKKVSFSTEDWESTGTSVEAINSITAYIKIYHKSDLSNPVFALEVPRHSREKNSYIPVGTIIGWAGRKEPDNEDGTWLECDGSGCLLYGSLMKVLKNKSGFLPDFTNRYLCGGDASTVGNILEQKVPNLKCYFELNFVKDKKYGSEYHNGGGAFTLNNRTAVRYAIDASKNITIENKEILWLDASDMYIWGPYWAQTGSEPVYSNDITNAVQPKTAIVRYFMKAD